MNKELEQFKNVGDDKIKNYSFSILMRFFAIFALIFLLQLPGCVIVLADDAGQINYFDHETLIEFSKLTFAFPLRLVVDKIDSDGQLLLIYMLNLVLISFVILIAFIGWRQIKKNKEVSTKDFQK